MLMSSKCGNFLCLIQNKRTLWLHVSVTTQTPTHLVSFLSPLLFTRTITFMFLVGIKLWTMDGLHVLPEGAGIGVTLRTARGLTHIGFLQQEYLANMYVMHKQILFRFNNHYWFFFLQQYCSFLNIKVETQEKIYHHFLHNFYCFFYFLFLCHCL